MQLHTTTEDQQSCPITTAQNGVKTGPSRLIISGTQIPLLVGLIVAAAIPRIVLAIQLDLVTDEIVYISVGKRYWSLLQSFHMSSTDWRLNYEHPPLAKVLIGASIWLNTRLGHPLGELLAARLPSIVSGTLLVVMIYLLGRAPFGRVVAGLAALCLAFSPWLVYFSGLAYLDMTMTALITTAFLLLWHAIQRPWLYLLVAVLVGLAADSKYTAVLEIPGMFLFTAYYFLLLRPRLPVDQRPRWPWPYWLVAIVLAPATFLAMDPAIWPHPRTLLLSSFKFEWDQAVNGHLTFLAGQYSLHIPHWAIIYIIATKMSALVTVPAAFFVLFAVVQLVRFHLHSTRIPTAEATSLAFLLIWLLTVLGMFSLLNIVVGTHYHLPLAAPVALAGASGLAILLRYRRGQLFVNAPSTRGQLGRGVTLRAPWASRYLSSQDGLRGGRQDTPLPRFPTLRSQEHTPAPLLAVAHVQTRVPLNPRAAIVVGILTLALVGPHLFGLLTVPSAEGYTSVFFHGEDSALQVAYPDYRAAAQWLEEHTHGSITVGLGELPLTLGQPRYSVSWFYYNQDFPARMHLSQAPIGATVYHDEYLIWPMHLVQRGYAIPAPWRSHILHIEMGGSTIYCYIAARSANAL